MRAEALQKTRLYCYGDVCNASNISVAGIIWQLRARCSWLVRAVWAAGWWRGCVGRGRTVEGGLRVAVRDEVGLTGSLGGMLSELAWQARALWNTAILHGANGYDAVHAGQKEKRGWQGTQPWGRSFCKNALRSDT